MPLPDTAEQRDGFDDTLTAAAHLAAVRADEARKGGIHTTGSDSP